MQRNKMAISRSKSERIMIYESYISLLLFILALSGGNILSTSYKNIEKSHQEELKKYKRKFLWQNKAFHGFPKIMK
jgi:hypothetical protein